MICEGCKFTEQRDCDDDDVYMCNCINNITDGWLCERVYPDKIESCRWRQEGIASGLKYLAVYTYEDYHDYGSDVLAEFAYYNSKQDIIDELTATAKNGNESTFIAIYEVPKNLVDEFSPDMEEVEKYLKEEKEKKDEARRIKIEEEKRVAGVYRRSLYEELKKEFEGVE